MKKFTLTLLALLLVAGSCYRPAEAYNKSRTRKPAPKKKTGNWTRAQKDTARKALVALEELDKWIKFYPSYTAEEYKKKANDAGFIVNQSVAVLPESTIKKNLDAASAGFNVFGQLTALIVDYPDSEPKAKVERQLADILKKTRQRLIDVRKELATK